MPEGPEVTTIVRALDSQLRGVKIIQAENQAPWSALLEEGSPERLEAVLGKQIIAVRRVGKNIVLQLENGFYFIVHLLMTGQLLYGDKVESPYLRWCLLMDNGKRLCLADKRKWVRARILTEEEFNADNRLHSLGMDVLTDEFTYEGFEAVLRSTKRPIHTVLLDQKRISGLGNIYVNEALFCAALDPRTPTKEIPPEKAIALYWAIYYIVREALRYNGTTFSDYRTPDGKRGRYQQCLRVFKRKGKPCVHCGAPLITLKIGGRGAYVCPHCQLGEPRHEHSRVKVEDTQGQWTPRLYILSNADEETAREIAHAVPFATFAESEASVEEILGRGDDAIMAASAEQIPSLSARHPTSPLLAQRLYEVMRLIYAHRCACPDKNT